jgi:hypothetical protein
MRPYTATRTYRKKQPVVTGEFQWPIWERVR